MRKAQMFLAVLLLICVTLVSANAEILTIDLDNASYEEIDNAYQQLKQERLDKIKEKFKETYEPEPKSDIMFRGIPWGTTRSEVEQQIGITSRQSTYLSKLNRVIGEDIGISTSYSTFQLAGYSVSTDVNYVYPIEEGVIIRDADLAMIVFVEYIIFDVSDASKVVDDLTNKLVKLYGNYQIDDGARIWFDNNNNAIQVHPASTRIYIIYTSEMTDRMIDSANQVRNAEVAEQEELLRIQNQNNYDGL